MDVSYIHGYTNFGKEAESAQELKDDKSVDMIWCNGEVKKILKLIFSV
jgi:predicted nucleic acid-binding Zn ribbon protein